MPGLARNVEYDWKNSASPTGVSSLRAMSTSAAGRSPNSVRRSASSVATHSCASFSYSARPRMNARITGTSSRVAALIEMASVPCTRGLLTLRTAETPDGAVASAAGILRIVILEVLPALDRTPPRLVFLEPLDCRLDGVLELVLRPPAQL